MPLLQEKLSIVVCSKSDYSGLISTLESLNPLVDDLPQIILILSGYNETDLEKINSKFNSLRIDLVHVSPQGIYSAQNYGNSVIFSGNYTSTTDIYACTILATNNAIVIFNNNVFVYNEITINTGSSFTMNNNNNIIRITTKKKKGKNATTKNAFQKIVRKHCDRRIPSPKLLLFPHPSPTAAANVIRNLEPIFPTNQLQYY